MITEEEYELALHTIFINEKIIEEYEQQLSEIWILEHHVISKNNKNLINQN